MLSLIPGSEGGSGFDLTSLLPLALTIPGVFFALYLARVFLDRMERHRRSRSLFAYGVLSCVGLGGVFVVILAIPDAEDKSQLLTIVGLLLSAAVAVSSTNFLGNVMAGMMLRSFNNFHVGDFLRCGEYFGRVSERGLLHTELQTEDRDLTTLPNLYVATRPIKVVRSSGTLVSATVSLGYDVSRKRIRALLMKASERAGLSDPFVQIVALGDDSIEYRVGGLLESVTELLTTRSRLRGSMLDCLHEGGVEIVSPTFMNTRALAKAQLFVPPPDTLEDTGELDGLEAVAFDKADLAVVLERMERERAGLLEERDELQQRQHKVSEPEAKDALADEISRIDTRLERVDKVIELRKALIDGDG